ncbi:MAG: MFS transporter [Candidatus Acidiferrum sp.]
MATESQTIAAAVAPPSSLPEASPHYYGWRVVLAACFGVMAGFGSLFVYTFAVFVKPLSAEFGWTREAISSGFGFAAITLAVVSPLLGRALDRFGPRRIILPCMTVFAAGIASLALLHSHLLQFYLTCVLLGAVGNGAAHLSYSRSISTWFYQRLGMALAFVMLGAGFGAMLLPPFAQFIITHSGWRPAYAFLGGLAFLLGFPLSYRYIRERRDAHPSTHDPSPAADSVPPGLSWQQGLRSYSFWIIIIVLFLSSISMNGAITHLSALLTDRGITARNAALCASMIGGSSLLGRIGVGWLLDRYFGARVAFFINLATAAGILLLARASTFSTGCLAAALIGIGAGGEADITPYLLTRYFGLRGFSTLYGLTWTFYAVAGAIGPVILGHAYDSTGSYTSLLTLLAAATAFGALLLLFLPRYSSQGIPVPARD